MSAAQDMQMQMENALPRLGPVVHHQPERIADAEVFMQRGLEIGTRVQGENAVQFYAAQLMALREHQARLIEPLHLGRSHRVQAQVEPLPLAIREDVVVHRVIVREVHASPGLDHQDVRNERTVILIQFGAPFRGWGPEVVDENDRVADRMTSRGHSAGQVTGARGETVRAQEQRDVRDRGLAEKAVQELTARGLTYEQDGALWFRSTAVEGAGDDQDRVLRRRTGELVLLGATARAAGARADRGRRPRRARAR